MSAGRTAFACAARLHAGHRDCVLATQSGISWKCNRKPYSYIEGIAKLSSTGLLAVAESSRHGIGTSELHVRQPQYRRGCFAVPSRMHSISHRLWTRSERTHAGVRMVPAQQPITTAYPHTGQSVINRKKRP